MLYKFFKIFIHLMLFSLIFSEDSLKSLEYIPDVTLKDINKKKVKLLDLSKDKFVVFNFGIWHVSHVKKK